MTLDEAITLLEQGKLLPAETGLRQLDWLRELRNIRMLTVSLLIQEPCVKPDKLPKTKREGHGPGCGCGGKTGGWGGSVGQE